MEANQQTLPNDTSSSGQIFGESQTTEEKHPISELLPNTDEFLEIREVVASAQTKNYSDATLNSFIEMVQSEEKKDVYAGLIGVRKLLSREKDPPIQEVIDSGIVPRLKDFLMNDKEPYLQFEAAWALTNIASGTNEQTKIVIEDRGIQLFVRLLGSPHRDIQEQAVWALGNVAGDSAQYRDMILEKEGMDAVIELYNRTFRENRSNTDIILKRNISWTMSNFCRGTPKAKYSKIAGALAVFGDIFQTEKDQECLADSAWGFSYLLGSDGAETEGAFDKFIEMNLVPITMKWLSSSNLTLGCLRIIGSFASATDNKYREEILKLPGLLDLMEKFSQSEKKSLQKKSIWLLSNVAAGTPGQVTRLIQHSTLMGTIFKLVEKGCYFEVRKEAVYLVANLIDVVDYVQLSTLIEKGLGGFFYAVLRQTIQAQELMRILEGLLKLFKMAQEKSAADVKRLTDELETQGVVSLIQDLQQHDNPMVCEIAVKIENLFESEEAENGSLL